ncbi:hypothetical protein [Bacteroides sp.]|uniref:hypothetical protein n=1 Tax=Bacteroides sp. TaxID=29523 RepID=UPI00262B44DE|nr:hypothetical protein [Bacteroides sp.]
MKWILLIFWGVLVTCVGLTGCDERIDETVSPSVGEKLVAVSLNFGFAEDTGDELYRNGSPQRLAATARRNGSPQRLAATARRNGSR